MSKEQDALKLALEALEEINKLSIGENAICLPAEIDTAMDAIREALAEQPAQQQEPWPEEPEGHIARGVQPSKHQARWSERWYGSTERGWWINCGYERIAYLGTEVSSDEVRKIVDAHNRTSPPPRKPLTDDEIHDIYDEVAKREPYGMAVTRRNIARAIEAAHGIKEQP